VPDILCCINGHFVGLELKAIGGKPSELQLWNLDRIDRAGGLGLLVDPINWEEIRKGLLVLSNGEKFGTQQLML